MKTNSGGSREQRLAEEIVKLEQENARLRAALKLYAGFETDGIKWMPIDDKGGVARAALEGKDD